MEKVNIKSSKILGQLIRASRKAQGLTQYELAGITNTGIRFISDLENGKETAQLNKALHVATTLGMKLYTEPKWEIK